ncbi:ribonuclease H-like domain-containing protein [Tanacetum coccineum]
MFYSRDAKFYETIFPYKMSLEKDKCLVNDSSELKEFSQNDDLTIHKTFFDDFQTDGQASSPNDDGGEPSNSNIGSESESDDTAREQSSDNDQGSMQIGKEDFSEGNVFENFNVPTNLFNTEKSNTKDNNTLRRSSRQSKLPPKLNDYVLDSKVRYGLEKFANHTWLSVENCGFIANINMSFEPKSYEEAAFDKNWVQAMNDEMEALHENNSWDLVDLPKNRKAIGSKWVYKIKHKSTWEIDRYKARLVAKWFNQREGIDYEETFSPVVKMGTDVYMLSPPGYYDKNEIRVCKLKRSLYGLKQAPKQWNNRFFEALVENDFKQSGHDHSLYTKESGGSFVALLVYVDDIVLTGNNINEINKVKTFLKSKFKIKDLGELKYFLGIEYIQAPLQSHMDIALRVLRYLKGALGSGVNYEKSEHMSLKVYVDSDWAKCPVTRRSVSGYCVSMAAATCELMRVVNILKDLKVTNLLPAELFCENRATIQIAANPVMHEKTKHFDLDIHIIREKVASGLIKTAKIDSENQTADIFTKALGFPQHNLGHCLNVFDKLGFVGVSPEKLLPRRAVACDKSLAFFGGLALGLLRAYEL